MKTVTFKKVNDSKYVIFINSQKAGLLQLSHLSDDTPVKSDEKNNWRIFFWGNYSKFQVEYEDIGMTFNRANTNITLDDVKQKIISAINNNKNAILPQKYFEERGYVLCHSNNGEIYTISTDYQDKFTEYFSITDRDILHKNLSELKERAEKLVKYYKENGFTGYGEITNIEYVMTNTIFNTQYYYS